MNFLLLETLFSQNEVIDEMVDMHVCRIAIRMLRWWFEHLECDIDNVYGHFGIVTIFGNFYWWNIDRWWIWLCGHV